MELWIGVLFYAVVVIPGAWGSGKQARVLAIAGLLALIAVAWLESVR